MKKSCLVENKWKFLWWSGKNEYYRHEFGYSSKTKRKCVRCGLRESFFGKNYNVGTGYFYEDWRTQL